MIVWLLCGAFLILGFAIGVYVAYPHKKEVEPVSIRIERERILLSKIKKRDQRIMELEKELSLED